MSHMDWCEAKEEMCGVVTGTQDFLEETDTGKVGLSWERPISFLMPSALSSPQTHVPSPGHTPQVPTQHTFLHGLPPSVVAGLHPRPALPTLEQRFSQAFHSRTICTRISHLYKKFRIWGSTPDPLSQNPWEISAIFNDTQCHINVRCTT